MLIPSNAAIANHEEYVDAAGLERFSQSSDPVWRAAVTILATCHRSSTNPWYALPLHVQADQHAPRYATTLWQRIVSNVLLLIEPIDRDDPDYPALSRRRQAIISATATAYKAISTIDARESADDRIVDLINQLVEMNPEINGLFEQAAGRVTSRTASQFGWRGLGVLDVIEKFQADDNTARHALMVSSDDARRLPVGGEIASLIQADMPFGHAIDSESGPTLCANGTMLASIDDPPCRIICSGLNQMVDPQTYRSAPGWSRRALFHDLSKPTNPAYRAGQLILSGAWAHQCVMVITAQSDPDAWSLSERFARV